MILLIMNKKLNGDGCVISSIDDSVEFFEMISPRLIEYSYAKSPYEFLKYVDTDSSFHNSRVLSNSNIPKRVKQTNS